MFETFPPKSVVVGIDGPQAAVRAALWAVDEVAGTDIPLKLLYVRESSPTPSRREARAAMATAEEAVYDAYHAINAVGKPVKVEMEVVEGASVQALIQASRSTQLICIGDVGFGQSSPAGFGSTATTLVHAAHCAVAVIRGDHSQEQTKSRCVVAHIAGCADEACRRNAPLVVMTAWQSGFDDLQNDQLINDHERRMRDILDRYVTLWTPHHPEARVRTVAAYGPLVNYLAEHGGSIQLVIVGATQIHEVQQLVSPAADPALRHSDFALLIAR
jgi:nucleotide-binding universal stress UspA family protein